MIEELEQAISIAEQGQIHPIVLSRLIEASKNYLLHLKMYGNLIEEASYRPTDMRLLSYDDTEPVQQVSSRNYEHNFSPGRNSFRGTLSDL